MEKVKDYIIAALLLGLLFSFILMKCESKKTNSIKIENDIFKDTIDIVVKEDSSTVSKIKSMFLQNNKQLLQIKSKDIEIVKLQEELKKSKKIITSAGFSTETKVKSSVPTVVFKKDSIFPEYKGTYISPGGWVTIETTANKDFITSTPTIKNSFTVTLKEEGKWYNKTKKTFAEVLSKNPYTEVKSLRAVNLVDARKKKLNFKIRPSLTTGVTFQGNIRTVAGVGIVLDYSK